MNGALSRKPCHTLIATLVFSLIMGAACAEGIKKTPRPKHKLAPPATQGIDAASPYLAVTGGGPAGKTQEGATNDSARRQDKQGNFEIRDITSPRDPASGQATGQYREGGVNDTTHIVSPRDSQSGLPHGIVSPRDPASGQATGQYREGGVNDTTHIVSPRDSQSGIVSPRDPASGQATGK